MENEKSGKGKRKLNFFLEICNMNTQKKMNKQNFRVGVEFFFILVYVVKKEHYEPRNYHNTPSARQSLRTLINCSF